MAENALGHLFLEQGRAAEAEKIFAEIARRTTQAVSDQPRSWIAALNLAFMKNSAHDSAGALATLDEARASYPDTWRLIAFESEILRNTGESESALALVEQFRATHWWHCAAAIEAGRIHLEQHRYADAEAALSRASWLDVHDAESLNLMAALNIAQNRIEAAFENQRRAVRRQPDQPRQYVLLSDVLERLGRHAEAQDALAQLHSLRALAKAN
jgi:tetratricopeptide (TPR) repeat protein